MIPSVTANNVADLPFQKFIDGITPLVLEPVPEGTGDEDMQQIDKLLARFANLYTYLATLHAVVGDAANRARVMGDDERQKALLRKKEALWEISRGVKLKWMACSRKLTKHIEDDDEDGSPFEAANHGARKGRKQDRAMKGWGDVS